MLIHIYEVDTFFEKKIQALYQLDPPHELRKQTYVFSTPTRAIEDLSIIFISRRIYRRTKGWPRF